MTTPTKCDFCNKRGLPLLLVRDAVAPIGASAPLAPGLTIELPSSAAHYTKRLLRSGYVNVFDEARKKWETYFVTNDAYFFKVMGKPGSTPIIPKTPLIVQTTAIVQLQLALPSQIRQMRLRYG